MGYRNDTVGVVDFGSREIRVLIARQSHDGSIEVLGHGTAPSHGCISQGVIQDRNAAQIALKNALTAAEKEARIAVHSLFCGINGRNVETFVREGVVEITHDVVEEDHMLEVRDLASRDILAAGRHITSSITAQEWYVDDLRVLNPLGIRGQVLKTRMHLARLPRVIEENITQCIESVGRDLEDMIFLPIAASLGCLTPEDMELGVAVFDLGRSTTGLAVYREMRILGSHSFEMGGYHITRDVAAGLQISFEEADELILEYGIAESLIDAEYEEDDGPSGNASNADDVPHIKLKTAVPGAPTVVDRAHYDAIVFERAKELMSRVRQYVNSRGLSKNLVRGIVLTGGAARIGNVDLLVEAIFQTPCRVGTPTALSVLPHSITSPEYIGAVGIVRHAFQHRMAARNGHVRAFAGPAGTFRRVGRLIKRYFL